MRILPNEINGIVLNAIYMTKGEDHFGLMYDEIYDFVRLYPYGFEFQYDLNDGEWHHVVVVVDGNKASVWIDGAVRKSGSFTQNVGDEHYIGLREGVVQPFRGHMDEFAIWSKPLTSNEIGSTGRAYGRGGPNAGH